MSSQISKGEMQMGVSAAPPRSGKRPRRMQRSTSLDSIKKINSFICSPHYNYILPALLSWCRPTPDADCDDSGSGITVVSGPSKASRCLTLCYEAIRHTVQQLTRAVQQTDERLLLAAAVYTSLTLVFVQLTVCVACLVRSEASLPAGLIFLITCLYLITQISFDCLLHSMRVEADIRSSISTSSTSETARADRKRLNRRRDVLGKRTISNLSLFS